MVKTLIQSKNGLGGSQHMNVGTDVTRT